MYVCICNAVTECDIRAAKQRGCRSLSELQEETGTATCCGSCADAAESMLAVEDEARAA